MAVISGSGKGWEEERGKGDSGGELSESRGRSTGGTELEGGTDSPRKTISNQVPGILVPKSWISNTQHH
jgi:hypothetical protein